MRLATIIPAALGKPVAAVALADGNWARLSEVLGREVGQMAEILPWLASHAPEVVHRSAEWKGPEYAPGECELLPPVPRPPSFRDFYAFEQHVKTARARRGLAMVPAWYEIPAFYFSNPGSLVGDGAPVFAPVGSQELDFELELGIVIGTPGRDIPAERAWEHVAGLTIINDLSARDLQRAEMSVGLGPAKGKDFATAVGPWLVTLDEFSDRIAGERLSLRMRASVNGRELSSGNVDTLYHTIPKLIAHAARDAQLLAGDLIGTGTVGTGCILELGPENTGGWLKPGDVVELEIERIGKLRTPIVGRPGT